MKQIHDATISKRPISVPEQADIELLILNRTKVQLEIDKLNLEIDKLKEFDPDGFFMAKLEDRKNELAHDSMYHDPSDSIKHATCDGQYYEVCRILEMSKNIQNDVDEKKTLVEHIGGLIEKWSEKLLRSR